MNNVLLMSVMNDENELTFIDTLLLHKILVKSNQNSFLNRWKFITISLDIRSNVNIKTL